MATPHRLLLEKVFAALEANATLTGKVCSSIADNKPYPYVLIETAITDDFSTHTENGFQGEYQVNVWSQPNPRGPGEAMDLMEEVYDTLHENCFDLNPDFDLLSHRQTFYDIVEDDDNATYHGIQRFTVIIGGT